MRRLAPAQDAGICLAERSTLSTINTLSEPIIDAPLPSERIIWTAAGRTFRGRRGSLRARPGRPSDPPARQVRRADSGVRTPQPRNRNWMEKLIWLFNPICVLWISAVREFSGILNAPSSYKNLHSVVQKSHSLLTVARSPTGWFVIEGREYKMTGLPLLPRSTLLVDWVPVVWIWVLISLHESRHKHMLSSIHRVALVPMNWTREKMLQWCKDIPNWEKGKKLVFPPFWLLSLSSLYFLGCGFPRGCWEQGHTREIMSHAGKLAVPFADGGWGDCSCIPKLQWILIGMDDPVKTLGLLSLCHSQ